LTTIGCVEQVQDACRGWLISADRCKFVGGRIGIILAALCCASVSGSQAFAEQIRVDAGPCSPDGDLAAQRARVSNILGRLAEKLQFVAVIRGCIDQHRIVVDISVLPNNGGDQPVRQPTSQPDRDGEALYLSAHGFSQEQQEISQ
jgi:hypothetical protein